MIARIAGLAIIALLAASDVVLAQGYPDRSIKVVVPAPPGGISDSITRLVTGEMQRIAGQSFVIENVSGAAGNVGVTQALKSTPDGYTVGGLTTVQTAAIATRPGKVVDVTRDAIPVIVMTHSCYTLVVPASLGVKTLKEFIALMKANPGKFSYGSAGLGSGHHLMSEMLKVEAGLDLVHVPYRGENPATTDLIAGRIQMMFHTSPAQLIESGQMVALGVTSAEPWQYLPNVPTIKSVLPTITYYGWSGLMVPTGTPAAIVDKLNALGNEALKSADVRNALAKLGVVPVGGPAARLAEQMARDVESFRKVAERQNIVIAD